MSLSPPCEEVSQLKTGGVRDLDLADRLFRRTRKIIKYGLNVNPDMWFTIENPATGLLCRNRDETKSRGIYYHRLTVFDEFKFVDLDYCRYSKPPANPACLPPADKADKQHIFNWEHPMQKQTRFWTNIFYFKPKTCLGKYKCEMMDGGSHHLATYGSNKHEPAPRYHDMIQNVDFPHRIPVLLIKDLLAAMF